MFNLRFISKIFLLIVFCNAVASTNTNSNDEQEFSNFVKSVHEHINSEINPCDNLVQYACGGNLNPSLAHNNKGVNEHSMEKLLLDYQEHHSTELNEGQIKAAAFFKSCKDEKNYKKAFDEINILKTVKQWPLQKDTQISEDDFHMIIAVAAVFNENNLIDVNYFGKTILFGVKFMHSTAEVIETLRKNMILVGFADNTMIEKSLADIKMFHENLNSIVKTSANEGNIVIENLDKLQEKIPDFNWDKFFTKYCDILDLDCKEVTKSFILNNFEAFNQTIGLMKATDIKILTNYLIGRFIDLNINYFSCYSILRYFKPIVIGNVLENYLNQKDRENHLKILNNFNSTFHDIIKLRLNGSTPSIAIHSLKRAILFDIEVKKYFLLNFKDIINDEELKELYRRYDINGNNYFSNALNTILANRKHLNTKPNETMKMIELTNIAFGVIFTNKSHNKPYDYYFTAELLELWREFYSHYFFFYAIKSEIKTNRILERFGFTADEYIFLWSIKLALNDYLRYVKDLSENDKNTFDENQIVLQKFNLNHKKLFFLSLTQYQCSISNEKVDNNFLNSFRFSKDFIETFSCSNDYFYFNFNFETHFKRLIDT